MRTPDNTTLETNPLEYSYDAARDVLTVEGVRYSGELFRALAWPRMGRAYQFRREDDLVIVRDCGPAPDPRIVSG